MQGAQDQLGEFLLDSGLLSRTQLLEARQRAEVRGEALSKTLVSSGVLGEEEVRRAEAHASGIPYVMLTREDIDVSALLLIPEPLCRNRNLVAFRSDERGVEVALLDLADLPALDYLKHHGRILPRLTSRESLRRALLSYQKHLKEKFDSQLSSADASRALEALIGHVLLQGASAVHLELAADAPARIRYRIGGVLQEALVLSPEKASRIATELKSLAKFQRSAIPQEARLRFSTPEPLSVRASLVPTISGEKIVLNFSSEREGRKGFTLESLGFHGEALEAIQRMLHAKTGLLAVVGTPGSGVTTTLYTLLDLLDHPNRALASVEREVEYRLPRVSQTQIDESVGLSATAAVRGALRQDPDVIMLSDVDEDAALSLAGQAARRCLVIVGVEESAELPPAEMVVRQRLVRRLCSACKKEQALSGTEKRFLEEGADFARVLSALKEEGIIEKQTAWKEVPFWQAEGCSQCEGGYRGFVGLQEVSIAGEAALNIIEEGLFKAAQGLTTPEEVVRVASEMGK